MHGIFEGLPERRTLPSDIDTWTDFGASLAFASIPIVLAIVAAILGFGSKATVSNVVDVAAGRRNSRVNA